MWLAELVKLLRLLTHGVAIALVLCGAIMLLVSMHSQLAALYAVIFFGIAAALTWSVQAPIKRT